MYVPVGLAIILTLAGVLGWFFAVMFLVFARPLKMPCVISERDAELNEQSRNNVKKQNDRRTASLLHGIPLN